MCSSLEDIPKSSSLNLPAGSSLSLRAVTSQDGGFTRRPDDDDRWPELITLFVLQMGSIILMCPAHNIERF